MLFLMTFLFDLKVCKEILILKLNVLALENHGHQITVSFFRSEAPGLVISRSYEWVKPSPSLFPSLRSEPGGPPFITS